MVPSPTEVANTDRGNIQDAIDQAYENGGGTVILQKGKYVVNQASVDDYYAIEMKGGVKLIGCSSGYNWNSPDLGTIISVNNPDRSISVIWTSPDVMLYHGIVIKDIRFANGDVSQG